MFTAETIYVTISNSDNRLPQREWRSFIETVRHTIMMDVNKLAGNFIGSWFSEPVSEKQSAIFGFTFGSSATGTEQWLARRNLRGRLVKLGEEYGQDYTVWVQGEPVLLDTMNQGEEVHERDPRQT